MDLLKIIPVEVLVILVGLLAALFWWLFRYTIKKMSEAFEKINIKLDLVCMNQEATDFALNNCKVGNGKSYMEYRDKRKKELINEYGIKQKLK